MPEAGPSIACTQGHGTANLSEWRGLIAQAAAMPEDDLAVFELELAAATNTLWRCPVEGWPDIVLRAEIAAYWYDLASPDGQGELAAMLADTSDRSLDDRALMHLLAAVLGLAGGGAS